jgi:hypothetical protein
MIAMTRSISVLIVAICFAPCFGLKLKRSLLPIVGLSSGTLVAISVFGDRIRQALDDSGGSVTDFISVGVNSWRNIPDLIMIVNYRDFLLPGNAAEIRGKISDLAASWSPSLAWIENTYSTFSAGASTLGLVATTCLFVAGIAVGLRSLSSGSVRSTWFMLYVANWFITPKFEAAGWVALGLLILLDRPNGPEHKRTRRMKRRASLIGTAKPTLKLQGESL